MSYEQIVMRQSFSGEKASTFMNTEPVTVPPDTTVEKLVNDYIYRYHYKMFPVTENGKLVGCISTKEIRDIPKDQWRSHKVIEYADRCTPGNTVSPDTDAAKLLMTMQQSEKSRLMVVDNGKLLGIISLKDMLRYISLKSDIEGGAG